MKTVKIILKFKFLTLFSDKIIQCYTESTVYTIITLFLYGIGAIKQVLMPQLPLLHYSYMELELFNTPVCFIALIVLHYSYMELELYKTFLSSLVFHMITLFLYGIGAFFYLVYFPCYFNITLFLYGIGAYPPSFCVISCNILHYSYMELEHNYVNYIRSLILLLHYSYMELEL